MDAKRIGQRLQSVRKSRGMTQAALAQAADLSVKYVSNIKCGNKIPTLETFITIANALQIDANTLLSDVLDVSVSEESGDVSSKLAELAPSTQRKFLRVLDALIDEFGETYLPEQMNTEQLPGSLSGSPATAVLLMPGK